MIPYAQLRPGPGFKPQNAALYYSHRLAVAPTIRKIITRSIATALNLRHGYKPPPLSDSQCRTLEALRKDGIADLPAVSFEIVDRLVQRLNTMEVIYSGTMRSTAANVTAGTALAAYPMDAILSCPD